MTFITKWFDSFQMFSKQTESKQSYALEYNSTLTPINFKSEVDEQRNQSVEIFAKLKTVNQKTVYPFQVSHSESLLTILWKGKSFMADLHVLSFHPTCHPVPPGVLPRCQRSSSLRQKVS